MEKKALDGEVISQEAVTLEDALAQVDALTDGGASLKDAAKAVAASTGIPKNELYNAALKRK